MAEFRFHDNNTATDYDYLSDKVRPRRKILRGDLVSYGDGSRELKYEEAVVVVKIEGIWQVPPSKSHSKSAEDLWQLAIDEAIAGRAMTLTPDLTDNSNVTVDVLPVPGEGPDFYRTKKGANQTSRSVIFESDSTFDDSASIWDDLKTLTDVL